MKRSSLGFLFYLTCLQLAHAQQTQFDVNLEGFSSFGSVRINNLADINARPVSDFNYSDIAGSAYWDEHWNTAMLYTATYHVLLGEVKLNFYTNELWYKEAGKVLAIIPGSIKKIVFYQGRDTGTVTTEFIYLPDIGDSTNHYFKVLNGGKTQLFRLDNVIMFEKPYDVTAGKHEFSFMNRPEYYLFHNSNLQKLRSLSKDAVLNTIQPGSEDLDWLKRNSNKLRNEKDFIAFFNYYNQEHPTASKP